MKFNVLALDYDGTIAEHGKLNPEVKAAISDLRRHGVVVILVTGRILPDLRHVAGDLRFVDAVVAENGALLNFPNGGRDVVLGGSPPLALLAELRSHRIQAEAGQSVVEADAAHAERIIAAIRKLGSPWYSSSTRAA